MFEQVQVVRTLARTAWLYRWAGMISASILCVLGWGFVQSMPDTYQVQAKVLHRLAYLRPNAAIPGLHVRRRACCR